MNNKIKEIATEVGISVEYLTNTKQWVLIEALAERIVNECAQACETAIFEGQSNHVVSLNYARRVKQHFGVNELND